MHVDGKPNYSTVTVTLYLVRMHSIMSFNHPAELSVDDSRAVSLTTHRVCTVLASLFLSCCSCSPLPFDSASKDCQTPPASQSCNTGVLAAILQDTSHFKSYKHLPELQAPGNCPRHC